MIHEQTKQLSELKFRSARVPHMFDNVRVLVGSDEDIFEETFVTAIIGKSRVIKLKKSSLEYT